MIYDSINFYFDLSNNQQVEKIINSFNPETSSLSIHAGLFESMRGMISNLHVRISSKASKCYVSGSINKFQFGENASNKTLDEFKEGIQSLQKIMEFDPSKARISSLEFGHTFTMNNSPQIYYAFLGDKTTHTKNIRGKGKEYTLYYEQKESVMRFYDKGKESKIYFPQNLLRYECSTSKKHLVRHFGKELTLSNLMEERFFVKAAGEWYKSYQKIPKVYLSGYVGGTQSAPYEIKTLAKSTIINTYGGDLEVLLALIDDDRKKDIIGYQVAYRAKIRLMELLEIKDEGRLGMPIEELDRKVEEAYQKISNTLAPRIFDSVSGEASK